MGGGTAGRRQALGYAALLCKVLGYAASLCEVLGYAALLCKVLGYAASLCEALGYAASLCEEPDSAGEERETTAEEDMPQRTGQCRTTDSAGR